MSPGYFMRALVAAAAFTGAISQEPDWLVGQTFGILFDAGSTGTRATIYSWDTRVFETVPPNITVPISLVAYFSNKTTPGIDKPAGRAALSDLLSQCASYLNWATPAQLATYPIFLTATAGMRILDEPTRATALTQVRAIMAASPFLFQPSWARVISGEEEGTFGWIAANYLQNSLYYLDANNLPVLSSNTVGALDLGGASTQITYIPPQGVDMIAGSYRTSVTPTLYGNTYTHSFLYYGQNQGTANINELVLAAAFAAGTAQAVPGVLVNHPCFFSGTPMNKGYTNYTSRSVAPGLPVAFVGTSNWTQCFQFAVATMLKDAYCLTDPQPLPQKWSTTALLNAANAAAKVAVQPGREWTSVAADVAGGGVASTLFAPNSYSALPPINTNASGSTCSINGQYQPPLVPPPGAPNGAQNVTFYAFSGYTYLWEFYGLPYETPLSTLVSAVSQGCGMTFAQFNATYYNPQVAQYVPSYCLVGAFVTALLTVGYGIPTDSVFLSVAPSASIPATYAAGAMLYSVNNLAWSLNLTGNTTVVTLPGATASSATNIGLAVSLAAVCVVLVIALVYVWRAKLEVANSNSRRKDGPLLQESISVNA